MRDLRAARLHSHELRRARKRRALRYAEVVKHHGSLKGRMGGDPFPPRTEARA